MILFDRQKVECDDFVNADLCKIQYFVFLGVFLRVLDMKPKLIDRPLEHLDEGGDEESDE